MSTLLRLPHITVDLDAAEVVRDAVKLSITPLEVRLLRYLAAHHQRVVPAEELLVEVWGYRPGVQSRAVTFTVNRLRAKIERDKAAPEALLTVRGHGFQLRVLDRGVGWWVGSHEALLEFSELQERTHRLAVIGPAGVGKTALVRAWLDHAVRSAVRVDLSGVTDRATFLTTVAVALEVEVTGPVEQVSDAIVLALAEQASPLVLDGCEQMAAHLLEWCDFLPGSVVATSRIDVPGWTSRPVALPSTEHAVELLLQHARHHDADWSAEARVLAAIVDRLDRLPLAIELSAPAARWFSAGQLLERLQRELGPPAAESLDEAINWALSLLEPLERKVFAWLSVFGGWVSASEVEQVLGQTGVTGALATLERHGLLRVRANPPRVRLAVGVRHAAANALDRTGEREQAETAHRQAFLESPVVIVDELLQIHQLALASHPELAQLALRRALPALPSLRTVPWIAERLDRTLQSVEVPDPSLVAYAGWAAWRLGRLDEARASLQRASKAAEAAEDHTALAQAWSFAGALLHESGEREEARPWFEKTVELLRADRATGTLGRALNALAISRVQQGENDAARELLFEGLERGADDPACQVLLLNTLGNLYLKEGRIADASRSYERALAGLAKQELGFGAPSRTVVEGNLAAACLAAGDLDRAAELYERVSDAHRRTGRQRSLGLARASLGRVHQLSGRLEDAIESYRSAVALLEGVGDRLRASWTRAFHICALYDGDQADEAARSERLLREHEMATGVPIGPGLETLIRAHSTQRDARTGRGSWEEARMALAALEAVAHPELGPMVARLRSGIET